MESCGEVFPYTKTDPREGVAVTGVRVWGRCMKF